MVKSILDTCRNFAVSGGSVPPFGVLIKGYEAVLEEARVAGVKSLCLGMKEQFHGLFGPEWYEKNVLPNVTQETR